MSLIFQAMLVTEASMCLFQAGLGSLFDLNKAFAAVIRAAFYPSFFWLSRILLTENLALPLMVLTMLFAVHFLTRLRLKLGIALGFFFGLGNLVRGVAFYTLF